jgi:hypothetical protein
VSKAAIVAVLADDKVLLMKRADDAVQGGTWAFPGGHIEPDEDAHNAAARELWEETGYGTQVPLMFVNDDGEVAQYKTTVPLFTPTLNNEHTAYLWASLGNLPAPLHPGVEERIKNIMTSKRKADGNGWIEVEGNPISKVGVFPYSGRSIGAPEPGKIYNVYRPEEELSNAETIKSFQLLPFVNDHPDDMLGQEAVDLPNVDGKPVEGIIGEKVYYRDGYLYGNLKIFTDRIAGYIDAGKREVSAGFRCIYEQATGFYNGQPYDYIQRNIRGNHVALVNEGRMGPDVAVLDHLTMTFDAKELFKMADEKDKAADADKGAEGEMTLAELTTLIKQIGPQIAAINEAMALLSKPAGEAVVEEPALDAETEAAAATEVTPAAMDALGKQLKAAQDKITALEKAAGVKALDAKDVFAQQAQRDNLYQGVSRVVGAFDHSAMDAQGVAEYAVKKLGLKAPAGSEVVAVEAYLAAKPAVLTTVKSGADGKQIASAIRKHVDEANVAAA